MRVKIEFYESLTDEQLLAEIWEILCECDHDFVPHLSARESSYQSSFQDEESKNVLPQTYYEVMIKQHFLMAIDEQTRKLAGFMTFKSNYDCEELKHASPSNYITTICIKKDYRNKGITRQFYQMIESDLIPENVRMPYLSTRTWSLNLSHLHLLDSFGFTLAMRLPNHRGPGIDTVYYSKKV